MVSAELLLTYELVLTTIDKGFKVYINIIIFSDQSYSRIFTDIALTIEYEFTSCWSFQSK